MRFFQLLISAFIVSIAIPFILHAQPVSIIETIAGPGPNDPGDGGPATQATLDGPVNLFVDDDGTVYVVEWSGNTVRRIDPAGIITPYAGTSDAGFFGDDGPATMAQLNDPTDIDSDGNGNLYISDGGNHRIRRIDAAGIITTIAGTGLGDHTGDGGPATLATLNNPSGVALDTDGNIFISDYENHVIRKIDPSGIITTIAGTAGIEGFSGDNGPATLAELAYPTGIAVDNAGGVYFTEESNSTVRKIMPDGTLIRVAGTGSIGYSGDGGPATQADLNLWWPTGIVVDPALNVFVTDSNNDRVRMIDAAGIITTIAGTGVDGLDGDGGPATLALLGDPMGIDIDNTGNIYFPEWNNETVRKVTSVGSSPVTLQFSESFGRPDDLALVDLTLSSGVPVGGFEFKVMPIIRSEEENSPQEPAESDVVLEGVINDLENDGISIFHTTDQATGITTVLVVSIEGSDLEPGERTVLELVYRIDESVPPQTWIDLVVSDVTVSTPEATPLPYEVIPGTIHVGKIGDVAGGLDSDGDGSVNILDIVKVIKYVLGTLPLPDQESFAFWSIDINGDDLIDVRDLVGVIQQALEESSGGPPSKLTPRPSPQTVTAALDIAEDTGTGQLMVPLTLDSDGAIAVALALFSFDASVLTIGEPQLAGRAGDMQLAYYTEGGRMKLLLYSMSGRSIPAGEGTVALIPVQLQGHDIRNPFFMMEEISVADPTSAGHPVTLGETSLKTESAPSAFALKNAAPNPFNPVTTIAYEVPQQAHIRLIVYNLLGQEVARLVDQTQSAGRYEVRWNARNLHGLPVTSGIYIYRMISSTGFVESRRMTLLK